MKTKSKSLFKIVLTVLAILMVLPVTATSAMAYDGHGYRGHRDEHYRHFVMWHGHRGYWNTCNAVQVFINVD